MNKVYSCKIPAPQSKNLLPQSRNLLPNMLFVWVWLLLSIPGHGMEAKQEFESPTYKPTDDEGLARPVVVDDAADAADVVESKANCADGVSRQGRHAPIIQQFHMDFREVSLPDFPNLAEAPLHTLLSAFSPTPEAMFQ